VGWALPADFKASWAVPTLPLLDRLRLARKTHERRATPAASPEALFDVGICEIMVAAAAPQVLSIVNGRLPGPIDAPGNRKREGNNRKLDQVPHGQRQRFPRPQHVFGDIDPRREPAHDPVETRGHD